MVGVSASVNLPLHHKVQKFSSGTGSLGGPGKKGRKTVVVLLLHLFSGVFSSTTWVSQHQKGKPFWILLEQEMMEWQWHQLNHMQIICTLLQTDNHASTSPLSFYRPDALPAAQPTASKHLRCVLP